MPLAHFTLATRDVLKTQAFFAQTLRWRPIHRPGNIGRPAAWLEIAPGQELHIVEVAEFEPSPFEAEFGRHMAFSVPLAEFDGLKRRLVQHGAELIAPVRRRRSTVSSSGTPMGMSSRSWLRSGSRRHEMR